MVKSAITTSFIRLGATGFLDWADTLSQTVSRRAHETMPHLVVITKATLNNMVAECLVLGPTAALWQVALICCHIGIWNKGLGHLFDNTCHVASGNMILRLA